MVVAQAYQQRACIGATPGLAKFVPSPQSCNHYVVCMNGEAATGTCPPGYQFDVANQNCANHGGVDCSQCASIGTVSLPNKEDCSKYFQCTFGTRTPMTCPPGFMFDSTLGSCNTAHLVQCPGQPEYPWYPEYPGDDDWGGPPIEPPYPGDPGWPGVPGPSPQCLPGQVHHTHPTDCNRYYLCITGILWEHRCPSQLHWNERAMACDLPESARCVHGGPGGPGVPGQPIPPGDGPDIEPEIPLRPVPIRPYGRMAADDDEVKGPTVDEISNE